MISKCNDGNREFVYDLADWRGCAALEGTVEVPMLKPMRITRDDRGFIAVHVINVITVTVRMVIFVRVFVTMIVRFIRGIVMMDVRIVSSAMPMMNQAHDARSPGSLIPIRQLAQPFSYGKVSWDSVNGTRYFPAFPVQPAKPHTARSLRYTRLARKARRTPPQIGGVFGVQATGIGGQVTGPFAQTILRMEG